MRPVAVVHAGTTRVNIVPSRRPHSKDQRYTGPKAQVTSSLTAAIADVVLCSGLLARSPTDPERVAPAFVIVPYAALGFALLLARHRAPRSVVVLLCVHSVLASVLIDYRPIVMVLVAIDTTVSAAGIRRTLPVAAITAFTTTSWTLNEQRSRAEALPWATAVLIQTAYLAIVLVAIGIGLWRYSSRMEAERAQWAARQEAAAIERRRLARELHDNVAHAVTVMALQAAGARRLMTDDPATADDALATVDATAADAIDELRRMLGLLRSDSTGGTQPATSETERWRRLAEIDDLVERTQLLGVFVESRIEGSAVPLTPSVETAALYVVQEALINATKHAGPGANCQIVLRWQSRRLDIRITDDGDGASTSADLSTRNGLAVLSERVSLAGGTLSAGPGPERGFIVAASLPVG